MTINKIDEQGNALIVVFVMPLVMLCLRIMIISVQQLLIGLGL